MFENEEVYSEDFLLKTMPKIHPRWRSLEGRIELNYNLLQPEFENRLEKLLEKYGKVVNEDNKKKMLKALMAYVDLIAQFQDFYLQQAFIQHFDQNYPIPPTPTEDYRQSEKRKLWQKTVLEPLKSHPLYQVFPSQSNQIFSEDLVKSFFEEESFDMWKIKENFCKTSGETKKDSLIIIVGSDFEASSIRKYLHSEQLPDQNLLTNQSEDAYADCFLKVIAITNDFSERLIRFGLGKKKTLTDTDKFVLRKIRHEIDHDRCDELLSLPEDKIKEISKKTGMSEKDIINVRSPRYGEEDVEKEHIFIQEIGGYRHGYQGKISEFIIEKGTLIKGKLNQLIPLFLED
jgi:hypothetical protein